MGCTPSLNSSNDNSAVISLELANNKEMINIERIQDPKRFLETPTILKQKSNALPNIVNDGLRKQQEKLYFLQESKNFMGLSIEASNQVNQAILALTYNPLLYDESYNKLIGINKKILQKKQNRMSNLVKREIKAQQQIEKHKKKRLEKARSELLTMNYAVNYKRTQDPSNKQNKDELTLYNSRIRQSFTQKHDKIQMLMHQQQSLIC